MLNAIPRVLLLMAALAPAGRLAFGQAEISGFGGISISHDQQGNAAVAAGGGLRLLAAEKWGVRGEYRRVGFVNKHDFLGSSLPSSFVTGGVFVQF